MEKTAASIPQFQPASDHSLLILFGNAIDPKIHEQVLRAFWLLKTEPIRGVRNLNPAYSSLLVKFDPLQTDHEELKQQLRACLTRLGEVTLPASNEVEIPVCYGGEFGPDLEHVAKLHGMTPAQVVQLHSSADYTVYFLGFAPGFAYLGGLPEALATPRMEVPRTRVPQGSVGIGGSQTGVYPFSTPGGWRLIGRTPLLLFRPQRAPMNLLQIGDHVRFRPISAEEFAAFQT